MRACFGKDDAVPCLSVHLRHMVSPRIPPAEAGRDGVVCLVAALHLKAVKRQ